MRDAARRGWRSGVAVRCAAAVAGGYTLAALAAAALSVALPVVRAEAVLAGTMASFAVYVAAVVWAFSARSATRAWGGLVLAAVPAGAALFAYGMAP